MFRKKSNATIFRKRFNNETNFFKFQTPSFFGGVALFALMLGSIPFLTADDAERSGAKDYWVLLSDTHIPADAKEEPRSIDLNKRLEQARTEILTAPKKPKGIIITGDLVYMQGKTEDYQTLGKQLEPFDEAKIPVYLIPGNHDSYENFTKTIPRYAFKTPVEGKQIAVIETPNVNFFLLDSLGNRKPAGEDKGLLGEKQLEWLAAELDKRTDKPAILAAHHSLDKNDMTDSEKFWEIIKSRKQVKAYLYGHTHIYRSAVRDDVHVVIFRRWLGVLITFSRLVGVK
jgi:3',5'-cyclic AMP phosphodiesterase CpdA